MKNLHEECGIFGIYDYKNTGIDISSTIYYAMVALQHRGQESGGIAVNLNRDIYHEKDIGLMDDIFTSEILDDLKGNMGIGHVRYATAGPVNRENAQPLVLRYIKGNLAIAHNGYIMNTDELKREYEKNGAIYQTTSDTEVIAYTIARERVNAPSIEEAVKRSMGILKGAYSLVLMSPEKLIAARDPRGFRPLCMGEYKGSIVFASESCAFDAIGAKYIRELEAGEIVMVNKSGEIKSDKSLCGIYDSSICIFEYIYFARPDSEIDNQLVYESRKLAGRELAKEHPVDADIVISVPDSGIPSGIGYSMESGIPYEEGFIKNRYVGRTFISPTGNDRQRGVKMKINPLKKNVEGKRIIMVDDSLVRGTTSGVIVNLLKNAGAKEIHVRISSPPFRWPCYYGTDVPDKDVLIANKYDLEGIRKTLGADSLGFLSTERLKNIVPNISGGFCDACFTGNYPVE